MTDTLAVGYENGLVVLYVNPDFWVEDLATLSYKVGAIKHEILHIVFKHIFRYKAFNHKTIFNIAADLVVNQYVKPEQLIQGAVLLDNFPELKLKAHQHVNYYYNSLMDLYNRFSDDKNKEEADKNASWQILKSLLNEENSMQKSHGFWRNIENLSSAEHDIAESSINQALETSISRMKSDHFTKLPAHLRRYLEDFRQSLNPIINWRRVLKLFTNSSSHTQIKNTVRRPSKRYGSNPGIKVKKKQKVLIAIDTSGSIDMEELRDFFSEIYHIWKQGSEVLVVECDVTINQTYKYTGTPPKNVRGGGGTSFEAPLVYANNVFRPDALIYFTDGFGPRPSNRCNCPILWLISRNGSQLEYLKDFPGRKVKMN